MEKCKVIAIANQKGGLGKTTTTMNPGVGLANSDKRVLIIGNWFPEEGIGYYSVSLAVQMGKPLQAQIDFNM